MQQFDRHKSDTANEWQRGSKDENGSLWWFLGQQPQNQETKGEQTGKNIQRRRRLNELIPLPHTVHKKLGKLRVTLMNRI